MPIKRLCVPHERSHDLRLGTLRAGAQALETQQFGPVARLSGCGRRGGCLPLADKVPRALVNGVVDRDDGRDGGCQVFGRRG